MVVVIFLNQLFQPSHISGSGLVVPSSHRHGDSNNPPKSRLKSRKALAKHKQRKALTAPAALKNRSLKEARRERAQNGKPCILRSALLIQVLLEKAAIGALLAGSISSQARCNTCKHQGSTAIQPQQGVSSWKAECSQLIQLWVWPISVHTEQDGKGSAQSEHG